MAMIYNDVYITLLHALAEHEAINNRDDAVIFMSRNYYMKANAMAREHIVPDPMRIATFNGRPIEIVDCPGDKLWIGRAYPIEEGI